MVFFLEEELENRKRRAVDAFHLRKNTRDEFIAKRRNEGILKPISPEILKKVGCLGFYLF
jgi:hypothetical protein